MTIRSKFRLATGALAIAAALVAALAGASAASAGSCTAGVKAVAGGIERSFCGPAAVSVELGGRTIRLSQGTCARTSSYVTVNIGVFSTATASRSRPDYFGLDVGRVPGSSTPPAGTDGTYTSGIVMTLVYDGRAYSVISGATATLSAHRSRGSVAGSTLTREPMSARFSC